MSHVVIIGCGIVGAAIAYELSQVQDLKITVIDKQPPAQASTGAALGVLMGAISHKIKGNAEIRSSQNWNLEVWDVAKLKSMCPQVNNDNIIGAVYSPQDRQIDPTALTLALVDASQRNGVTFKFGVTVNGTSTSANSCK
mgnify:CR=1 FL=1